MLLLADQWQDYQILDAGYGEKLEKWKHIVLRRPDPQSIWPCDIHDPQWKEVHGHYHRSSRGGGSWEFRKKMPERWEISYSGLKFYIRPTGFKHTGLFPEQAVNWDWIMKKIRNAKRPIKVLNLFAYTGGATCAASYAGAAEVCHVDASKGMVQWAKENAELSGLSKNKIRYIVDDCHKFIQREIRRGNRYDAIIMDPPSYGRGPNGEVWKFEEELLRLLNASVQVLSDRPLFFLLNSYTTGLSPTAVHNLLELIIRSEKGGFITSGEIGLPVRKNHLVLPCGLYGRWEAEQ